MASCENWYSIFSIGRLIRNNLLKIFLSENIPFSLLEQGQKLAAAGLSPFGPGPGGYQGGNQGLGSGSGYGVPGVQGRNGPWGGQGYSGYAGSPGFHGPFSRSADPVAVGAFPGSLHRLQ